MKIRSGWTYLLAALLTGTVACSSDNNNGGTGGSGGHAGTTGSGGRGGLTGGAGHGGNGGNVTTGVGGNGGNVTTGVGGNGGNVTTGVGGNGGNHGGAGAGGSAGNHGGAGAGGNAGNHGGAGAGGNGGAVAALSDPQIGGIAYAANMGEVAQAQLAGTKSTNSAVLNFATMMITDHGAAITRLQQVLAAQNIITADSPERQSLTTMSNTTYNTLFTQSGATFDKTYATAQVTGHQTYLNLLDGSLIPDAQNAALKAELQMERTTVANHLTMAQTLVSALSSDGGVPHDAGGDAH